MLIKIRIVLLFLFLFLVMNINVLFSQNGSTSIFLYLENVNFNPETNSIDIQWSLNRLLLAVNQIDPQRPVPCVPLPLDDYDGFSFSISATRNGKKPVLASNTSVQNQAQFKGRLELTSPLKSDENIIIDIHILSMPPNSNYIDRTNNLQNRLQVGSLTQGVVFTKPFSAYTQRARKIRSVFPHLRHFISQGGIINYLLCLLFIAGIIAILFYFRLIFINPVIHIKYLNRWLFYLKNNSIKSIVTISRNSNVKAKDDIARKVILLTLETTMEELKGDVSFLSHRQLDRKRKIIYENIIRKIDEISRYRIRSKYLRIQLPGINFFWNIGMIAPMLGLLGTVLGISFTFGIVAINSGIANGNNLISKFAGNINLALNTTIAGLFVGILFFLFYYFFDMRCRAIENRLNKIAEITLNKLFDHFIINNVKVIL